MNVFSNVTYIIAQIFATLWLTPFLIGHLGIAAFGMIPLAVSITSYMAVLTTALHSVVIRYLAIDIGRKDGVAAKETFNTAFFGLMWIIILLSPVAMTVSFAFPALFEVPSGWELDASWLSVLVALSFFVTVLGSNFAVSPFIHSQFLMSNIANLAGLLARVSFIVIFFSFLQARLWYAGGGILFGAAVSLLGYIILWRKLTPELNIQISAFNRPKMQSMMAMGGWIVVNLMGAMLLSRADLFVVNAFFGAGMTGGYGSVAQFSLLMEHLVSAAGNVIRPVILIKFSKGDIPGLQQLLLQSIKLLGLSLALPVGLLCGFSRPILSLWLGPSFEYLSVLLIIIIFHQSLNLSVRPLFHAQNAYNKVRWPGIVTLISGGANVILAILLAMLSNWGAAGVAMAGAVIWSIRNLVYVPVYTARIMALPWWTFLCSLVPTAIGTLFVWMASYGLTVLRMPNSWFTLGVSAAIVSVLYVMGVWAVGLSGSDRLLLKEISHLKSIENRQVF